MAKEQMTQKKKHRGFANSLQMFAAKAIVGALSRRQSEPAVSN
jgi:hypothetical protein